MTEAWSVFILILKNWKYVAQFVKMVDSHIAKGINDKELQAGLKRLDKGFSHVKTIKDTADAARSINDSFRL